MAWSSSRIRLGCLLLVALPASHCKNADDKQDSLSTVRTSASWRQVRDFANRLNAFGQEATSAARAAETSCPDETIRQELGQGAGRLLVAERDYLTRYAESVERPPEGAKDVRWEFLTTAALRALPAPAEIVSPKASVDAAYLVKQLRDDYRYFAVIVVEERTLPEMVGEGFRPGAFSGAVIVYDLTTNEKLCQAEFSAASDDSIAVRNPDCKQEALWQDFTLRIRQALNGAIGRITRHLNLDIG